MKGDKLRALLQAISCNYGLSGHKLLAMDDELGTNVSVFFPFRNDSIHVRLIVSDTMYSFAKINFRVAVPKHKEEDLRLLLTEFNKDNSDVTFYFVSGLGITVRFTYTTNSENFDPYFFTNVVRMIVSDIDERYYDRITSLIKGV